MPVLDSSYITVFSPEEAAEQVAQGRVEFISTFPDTDMVRVKLTRDGSVWNFTAVEYHGLSRKAPASIIAVEKHHFVDGKWITSTEERTIPMAERQGEQIVHILENGLPFCRFSKEPPQNWPAGHYWVPFSEDMRETPVENICGKCAELAVPEFAKRWPKMPEFTAVGGEIGDIKHIFPIQSPAHAPAPYPPPRVCPGCNSPALYWDSHPMQQNYYCKACGWNDCKKGVNVAQALVNCNNCSGRMQYRIQYGDWICLNCGHSQP